MAPLGVAWNGFFGCASVPLGAAKHGVAGCALALLGVARHEGVAVHTQMVAPVVEGRQVGYIENEQLALLEKFGPLGRFEVVRLPLVENQREG